jgi:hypothetical protein
MPSPAQIKGRAILDSLLPSGMKGPDATIRARRCGDESAVAISLMPHRDSGSGGEYRRTLLVTGRDGPHEKAMYALLEHHVARWIEIEREVRRLHADNARAEHSGGGHTRTPAWRMHCPLVLRRICDTAGLDADARTALAVKGGSLMLDGFLVRVHEVDVTERSPWGMSGRGMRTVRRVTVERPGFIFSQGVNRCYMKVDVELPQIVRAAMVGLPLRNMVAAPGMADDCLQPASSGKSNRGRTEYDITRCFAMLAPHPEQETDA